MAYCCSCGKASTCAHCKCATAPRFCVNCTAGRHGVCVNRPSASSSRLLSATSGQHSSQIARDAAPSSQGSLSGSCPPLRSSSEPVSDGAESPRGESNVLREPPLHRRNSTSTSTSIQNRNNDLSSSCQRKTRSQTRQSASPVVQGSQDSASDRTSQDPSPESSMAARQAHDPEPGRTSPDSEVADSRPSQTVSGSPTSFASSGVQAATPSQARRSFSWGTKTKSGTDIADDLAKAWGYAVTWRRNVFALPS